MVDIDEKGIPIIYIVKDMYDRVMTNVRTCGGITSDFSITIGLHQGFVLSPFLYAIVMDELIRAIQDKIPWCMLFADDIVLGDETRAGYMLNWSYGGKLQNLEVLD